MKITNSILNSRLSTLPYHMPAEWQPHKRTWLSWPHAQKDWPNKFAPVPWIFAEMIRAIAASERVGLLVHNDKIRAQAMEMLDRVGIDLRRIDFVEAKTNRGWLRDCGAIYARDENNARVALDFGFNGWAKYSNFAHDNAIPAIMAATSKVKRVIPRHHNKPIILEGGGIDVDGDGSILVTEEWLLSDTQIRNKGFTREDYESLFAHYLGAPNTIWLGAGIVGDDTHGHVDDIARFVAPGHIVTVIESNNSDANYAPLKDNHKRLKKAHDAKGRRLEIIELPMPAPVICEGERLPASYANFLMTNGAVIVPIFGDVNDRIALNIIAQCFPKRDVIPVYARDLVWGFGTIHCLTQQEIA